MIRIFILNDNKTCVNIDNDADAQNLISQGAKEIKDLSIFKGYENLVSPANTVVNDDGSITFIAPKKRSLSELKSEKLAELTAITSKFDNQLVNTDMIIKSSLGFSINADLRSQNNLRGLIALGVEPVNFVTANNSVQSLSIEQLNVLLNECAQNVQHLYLLKWQYREQIEQAKTVEELNTIKFKFTMKDFSK